MVSGQDETTQMGSEGRVTSFRSLNKFDGTAFPQYNVE